MIALPKAFQTIRDANRLAFLTLSQASLFRDFALKKPLNFVERLCSETGI
jgi:hypothetical protein